MKKLLVVLLCCWAVSGIAQGPFDPGVDKPGYIAVHMDSMIIYRWVDNCEVTRGPQNISVPGSPLAYVGGVNHVTGKADGMVLSLGDGGSAIVELSPAISNHDGYDFAIFENGLLDQANGGYFLELAFVEVSSNGVDYYRFPNQSLTPTSSQTSSFGKTDPTMINGLAGKHSMGYGTPFDLHALDTVVNLDINAITHIKLIDVVGSIDTLYGSYDDLGNLINDPFPTEFGSAGFDLDAIALIDTSMLTSTAEIKPQFRAFPNPVENELHITGYAHEQYQLFNMRGELLFEEKGSSLIWDLSALAPGMYFLKSTGNNNSTIKKILKR